MGAESNNSKTMVKDLTEGNVAKLLIVFAAPLFVSNALQAIYNIVDMVVVGQVLGGSGMSAVSTGGNILHILTFLAMGFSMAGQIIVSQYVGKKDMEGVKRTIGTMFTLLLIMAIAVSIICFFLRFKMLAWVNTPAEAFEYTMDYTVICIAGLVFIYGYNIVSAIMRGMGDSKRPFMFVAIAAVLNTILDILFVAVLGLEVKGAALATVIGQGFSFIYALYYLYKNKEAFGFDFKIASFKPDKEAAGRIIALGIPMALQSAAIAISQTVVAAWVNSFGVIASATAGILSKLNMMMGIMSGAISTAASSMVGQNLGAKKYERVPRIMFTAFAGSVIFAVVAGIIMFLFPTPIFGLFTSDEAVLTYAIVIVAPVILNFFGAASRTLGFSIINGSGNSKLNLFVAILDGMISRIGIAYVLGFVVGLGPVGFWYGDALAGFVPCLIGMTYFATGKWKEIK